MSIIKSIEFFLQQGYSFEKMSQRLPHTALELKHYYYKDMSINHPEKLPVPEEPKKKATPKKHFTKRKKPGTHVTDIFTMRIIKSSRDAFNICNSDLFYKGGKTPEGVKKARQWVCKAHRDKGMTINEIEDRLNYFGVSGCLRTINNRFEHIAYKKEILAYNKAFKYANEPISDPFQEEDGSWVA